MSSPEWTEPSVRRRLNPFAFPSDTTFRFALLIVAVLSSSLYIYNVAYFPLTPRNERAAQIACNEPVRQAVESGATAGTPSLDALIRASNDCAEPHSRRITGIVVGGAAVLLLVTALIYMLTPSWLIRRRRLLPLSDDDAPGVTARFGELAAEAGLEHPPALLWNPLAGGGAALAFGRPGRSYVAVGAGLVTQFYKDRALFEAVVRHELAHLTNRDVAKAYLAVSIWRAFVVAALVPFAVMVVGQPGRDIWEWAWHVAALTVIVYLTRNGVLRAREYYADVRASQWDSRSALPRVLAGLPAGASSGWRRWVSVHPSPPQRLGALTDTRSLFRFGIGDAVGAGIMAGLALPILRNQLHELNTALGTPFSVEQAPTAAALIVGSLLGTVFGVGIWRATFGARLAGEGPPRTGRVVVGLAAGVLLGSALSLGTGGLHLPRPTFAVAVLAVMALLVGWLVATADACVDAVPASRSPRIFSAVGLLAAGLSGWAIGKLWVFDSGDVGVGRHWLLSWTMRVADEPLTLVMATAVCAVPLVGLLAGRRRHGSTPAWAWLDMSATDSPWPGRPRPRPATVLRWGLGAGTAFAVVVLVLHATGAKHSDPMRSVGSYFHGDLLGQFTGAERSEAAWKLGFVEFQRFFAFALVGVAAAGAALRSSRSPTLHGLFAGCIAALVVVPALLVLNAAFGGVSDLDFATLWARQILSPAVFVALAVGIAVGALQHAVHEVSSRGAPGGTTAPSPELTPV